MPLINHLNLSKPSIPRTVKQQEKRRSTANRSGVLWLLVARGGRSSKRHPLMKVLQQAWFERQQTLPEVGQFQTLNSGGLCSNWSQLLEVGPVLLKRMVGAIITLLEDAVITLHPVPTMVPNLLKNHGSPRCADFWPADDKSRFRTAVWNARRWRMPKQHESPHHALHPLASPGVTQQPSGQEQDQRQENQSDQNN